MWRVLGWELKNVLSFMQAAGSEGEERKTGCSSQAEAQKGRRGFVIHGEAGHKQVSSQVCSFDIHKSSQELGKPVSAVQGGGHISLAFLSLWLSPLTTPDRSAFSLCLLPSPLCFILGYLDGIREPRFPSPSLLLEFPSHWQWVLSVGPRLLHQMHKLFLSVCY